MNLEKYKLFRQKLLDNDATIENTNRIMDELLDDKNVQMYVSCLLTLRVLNNKSVYINDVINHSLEENCHHPILFKFCAKYDKNSLYICPFCTKLETIFTKDFCKPIPSSDSIIIYYDNFSLLNKNQEYIFESMQKIKEEYMQLLLEYGEEKAKEMISKKYVSSYKSKSKTFIKEK